MKTKIMIKEGELTNEDIKINNPYRQPNPTEYYDELIINKERMERLNKLKP